MVPGASNVRSYLGRTRGISTQEKIHKKKNVRGRNEQLIIPTRVTYNRYLEVGRYFM